MAEPQIHDYYNQSQTPKSPSSQIVALVTLVPLGSSLLLLAGLILTATVIGLAVTTPLFVLFSPILLPAAVLIAFAVAGFITSAAFCVTSLSSFSWLASYLRRSRLPERLHDVTNRAWDTVGNAAHRAVEAGESVVSKAQETVQGGPK